MKADPSDVIVASIAPPPTPFGTTIAMPCPYDPTATSCAYVSHSCVAATDPHFFGDPTVRLSAVVQSALTTQTSSLCDDDFSTPLADLAQKIIARLQ